MNLFFQGPGLNKTRTFFVLEKFLKFFLLNIRETLT